MLAKNPSDSQAWPQKLALRHWATAMCLFGLAAGPTACGDPTGAGAEAIDAAAAGPDLLPVEIAAFDASVATADTTEVAALGEVAPAAETLDTAADTAKSDAGCTEASCPCADNKGCDSGFCIETPGGAQCAKTCTDSCSEGYKCSQVSAPGGDIVTLCVPAQPRLCEPCQADSDCNNVLGGANSRCVPYQDASGSTLGNFCGSSCSDGTGCAKGFNCQDTLSLGGVKDKQCVKADLVCSCDTRAIKLQLATACSNASAAGTCGGKRACGVNGLSACDAPSAVGEACNMKDDDCDGQTDEPSAGMCEDGKDCTYNNCVGGACQYPPATGPCNDKNACTGNDKCSDGDCVGATVGCDDKNPCTTDACVPALGCTATTNDTAACSDGNACTAGDACQAGACLAGEVTSCDDGNLCTADSCVAKTGCAAAPNAAACSDGNACTTDTCDKLKGCGFSVASGSCDDNNSCTSSEVCKNSVCSPGSFKTCDDGNLCTTDGCDPTAGCVAANNTVTCSDGNACTNKDLCGNGQCVPGAKLDCDDKSPCTDDSCNPGGVCVNTANTAGCDDGDLCTLNDVCAVGVCKGTAKVCGATEVCAAGVCKAGAPSGMALISAGAFKMGCVPGDPDCDTNEKPQHTVTLDAFYIDVTEVTVAAYKKCVDVGQCTKPSSSSSCSVSQYANYGASGKEQHPVNCVNWSQADTYCKWTDSKGRLPTEAEWEKAARGGLDGKKYPWGDQGPTCTAGLANTAVFSSGGSGCAKGSTWSVGTGSSKNGYGLYDMSGNVWEWVGDWYSSSYYGSSPASNPAGPASGSVRVFRGGGFDFDDPAFLRASFRVDDDPSDFYGNLGFRCSRSYP